MKLIKWLAIWLGVGLGVLVFAANAVAEGFAIYWWKPVMIVCLAMGLLFGISGQLRAGKEKRQIAYELERLAGSHDHRSAWAADAKNRTQQVWNRCSENQAGAKENPIFDHTERAGEMMKRMTDTLSDAEALQSDLRAVVRTLEEEGGAV